MIAHCKTRGSRFAVLPATDLKINFKTLPMNSARDRHWQCYANATTLFAASFVVVTPVRSPNINATTTWLLEGAFDGIWRVSSQYGIRSNTADASTLLFETYSTLGRCRCRHKSIIQLYACGYSSATACTTDLDAYLAIFSMRSICPICSAAEWTEKNH